MDADRSSATAEAVAMLRHAHLVIDHEPRLLDDPFAISFLGDRSRGLSEDPAMMQRAETVASRSTVTARALIAEDHLASTVARGCTQYVILGAGFDSFVWRRPDLVDQLTVFEVDHPATQRRKLALAPPLPTNTRFVSVDFERDDLATRLVTAGWNPQRATCFSWLGVTMYLTDEAIFDTLRFVRTSAPGSSIVFQYSVAESELSADDREIRTSSQASVTRQGEPWLSFYRPAELETRVRALDIVDVQNLTAPTLNERYFGGRTDLLRWPALSAMMIAGW